MLRSCRSEVGCFPQSGNPLVLRGSLLGTKQICNGTGIVINRQRVRHVGKHYFVLGDGVGDKVRQKREGGRIDHGCISFNFFDVSLFSGEEYLAVGAKK